MLAEAACPKAPHEVSPTVPVQKGFSLGITREAPVVYSYATASFDCKVGKEIDFRELVYLMNGTLLKVAFSWRSNAPQKRHFGEKPLAQRFCWQCGRTLSTM